MYAKPPIIEAVIEFQFDGDCDEASREKISNRLKKYYPFKEDVQEIVLVNGPDITNQNVSKVGIKLSSLDRTKSASISGKNANNPIVQQRPAAFFVSQLAPYCGWEELCGRFNDNWSAVEKVLGHRKLTRIGVRFVNRIDVPLRQIDDFSRWVNVGVALPDQFKRPLIFNALAVIDIGMAHANLNVGVGPSPLPHHSAFILDIDIFMQGDISAKHEDRMMVLEDFHKKKNQLFEDCVTDAARELFK